MENNNYKILYVDDEEVNLRVFTSTFKRDFNIFTAISAKDGLKILEKEEVDLVIADQRMAGMTGVEFFKEILKTMPGPSRILLTAYGDIDSLREAINEAKIYQYVQKPWEETNLKSIIDKAIKSYHLDRKNKELTESLILSNKELENYSSKLKGSEKNLRLIYDLTSDILFQLKVEANDSFSFMSVNKTFIQSTGLAEEQIIGKTIKEIIPEPSYSIVMKKYKEAIRERKVVKWEETNSYTTGEKTGESAISPSFDNEGNCVHLIGSVHDITKRKKAENRILELNKNLESLVEERTAELNTQKIFSEAIINNLPGIFSLVKKDGTRVLWNKNHKQVTGYSDEEYDKLHTNDFFDGESKEIMKKAFTELNTKNEVNVEVDLKIKSGKKIPYYITLINVGINNENYIAGMGIDVSKRKEAEDALLHKTAELEIFNKVMIDRELRIIEMKEEVNTLSQQLELELPYPAIWK